MKNNKEITLTINTRFMYSNPMEFQRIMLMCSPRTTVLLFRSLNNSDYVVPPDVAHELLTLGIAKIEKRGSKK